MPIKSCQKDGKPGLKWGDSGTCYTFTPGDADSKKKAEQKVRKQQAAIEASKHKGV